TAWLELPRQRAGGHASVNGSGFCRTASPYHRRIRRETKAGAEGASADIKTLWDRRAHTRARLTMGNLLFSARERYTRPMPDQETVIARRDGRVGRIVLNRPQALNAL